MNDELERMKKEAVVAKSGDFPCTLMEMTEENHESLSQDTRCPADIYTELLMNIGARGSVVG
jgi:hypothetical protein